jgi:hypothetical protein
MLLESIVNKFSNLIIQNQEILKNNLKVLAGRRVTPLDRDSLKENLEKILRKKISSSSYNNWKELNNAHIRKIENAFWFDLEPNSILYSPAGDSDSWIITQNIKELRDYYQSPEESEDLDIHESNLLQAYGPIPVLYLIHADLESSFNISEPEQESPEIAHNLFIVEALKKFQDSSKKDDSLTKKDVDEFLKKNKAVIDNIKSSFQEQPRILGKGEDGITFSIGSNLVLKIFKEEHSYNKAKEAQERLWKNPRAARTEAMIYDVGILGKFDGRSLYYYIIQKMKPVRDHLNSDTEIIIEMIVNNVFNFISDNREDIFLPLKQSFNKKPNMAKLNNTIKSISRSLSLQIFSYIGESDIKEIRRDVRDTFGIMLRDSLGRLHQQASTDRQSLGQLAAS